jgi:hypothetical protein
MQPRETPRPGSINGDCWDGDEDHEWVTLNATDDDLVAAIDRLDNNVYSLLAITGKSEEDVMVIGGQLNGRFTAMAFIDETGWSIDDASAGDAALELKHGGADRPFTMRETLDRDSVLLAAREYLRNGTLHPSFPWRREEI